MSQEMPKFGKPKEEINSSENKKLAEQKFFEEFKFSKETKKEVSKNLNIFILLKQEMQKCFDEEYFAFHTLVLDMILWPLFFKM